MQEVKNKVEAVLFITGRAMSLEEIAQFCNIGSVGSLKDAMHELMKEYQNRPGGLEILCEDGKYRLNIKRQYNHLSTKLLSGAELDAPTQATLALIAYKQPILQSDIIKMRGNTAYDHVHHLKEIEFIASEKHGRTRSLKLAPKFFEYFDVVEANMKQKMQDVMERQEKLSEVSEAIAKEIAAEEAPAPEEKKKEKEIKLVRKKKDASEKEEAVTATNEGLEVERSPHEVLLSLDADDFGK